MVNLDPFEYFDQAANAFLLLEESTMCVKKANRRAVEEFAPVFGVPLETFIPKIQQKRLLRRLAKGERFRQVIEQELGEEGGRTYEVCATPLCVEEEAMVLLELIDLSAVDERLAIYRSFASMTEQAAKADSRRLSSFPMESPNPIIGLDQQGNISFENPACLALVKELALPDSTALLPLSHDRDVLDLFADFTLNLRRERRVADRIFDWTYKAVLEGSAIYLYGLEITQMRAAEEQRRKAEAQLNAAHRMDALGQLAGGVAHDFNNILTAINGYAQLLQFDLADKKPQGDYLEQILEASLRAKGIIAQILSFSRGKADERKPLNVYTLLKEIWPIVTATLPSHVLLQEFASPEAQREAYVHGSAAGLHQVLLNLITNAVQAMDGGPGSISIRLEMASGANPARHVVLSIKDNGKGMSAKTQERIFQPYFTTKATGSGAGLGLSVVYGIVQDLEGEISVESREGEGSCFTVTLPCLAREAIDALVETSHGPEAPAGSDRMAPGDGSILVVDDEPALVELMEVMLARAGYDVVGFTNPAEALEAFRQEPWSFRGVVSDNAMPEMTGLMLTEKLIELRADVPIVLCSGNREGLNDGETCPASGVTFFQKPVAWAELLAAVADFPPSEPSAAAGPSPSQSG